MNTHFQAIKERVDLLSEIQKRTGLTARGVGKNMDLSECPFCHGHDCFRIDPDKQLYNCFQCEAGGDVIAFVQKEKACSANEALKELAESCGYELPKETPRNSDIIAKDKKDSNAAIRETAAEYYHANLCNTSSALRYQTRNRRHSLQALKTFRVGYANGRLHEELQKHGFNRDQILATGLVRKKDGHLHDYFALGLYIYPHLTTSGQVGHFTIKDPRKKLNYQLPNEFKGPGCPFLNMPAFKGKEILLVEGENDLLSAHGRGGYHQVVACSGQLSKAQVEYLVKWAPGKTIYLCFDNDEAGQKYRAQIEKALIELCLPPKLVTIHRCESVNLRHVKYNQKCKDIDELLKKDRRPKQTLSALIGRSEPYLLPLKKALAKHRAWCEEQDRKFSYNEIGEIVFDYFRLKGKFFVDHETCYLFHEPKIYAIGNNVPFKSMLYTVAGLNYAYSSTKQVLEVLQARAYQHGEHTTAPGWIHTDRLTNSIFFNLCNDRNELIKISPENPEIIQNGVNPERILLRNSPKMRPLNYIPEVDLKTAMARLKALVFDNLACSVSNRYFILARLFNTLLVQFTKARGLDKYSGPKSSGKTTGASLITTLVYGQDYVTVGSAASDFSEATVSPLTIADNLEADNIYGDKRDFLLVAATGVTKQKRKSGTDSENVYERACTQVIITAIEPFLSGELIERTNDIHFSKKYFSETYPEPTAVESQIITNRDLIWSAFFKILAYQVLPGFNEKRVKALKVLRETYQGHSKGRLNELYSCLYILCNEILKHIPHPEYVNDPHNKNRMATAVLEDWLNYQEDRARATARGTNPILYRLEVLLKEYLANPKEFESLYRFEAQEDLRNEFGEALKVRFIAQTRDLFEAFEALAKNRGIACPFKSPSQLGARLGDSLDVLQPEGWEFLWNHRIIRGRRYHCIIKTIEG